jgi:hypothetical protein
LAQKLNLPRWWIRSVIVEYLPCRRYLENGSLWVFDFTKIDRKSLINITDKRVIIPEYYIVQNIRQRDLLERLSQAMLGGSPVAEMEEKDMYPEGILNDTCFPILGNPIEVWDPKLNFHTHAVVLDNGVLYQWKIADSFQKNHSSWFKSDLFDLTPLWNIYQKILRMNKPKILKNPTVEARSKLDRYYNRLEKVRVPLRKKIWEYHLQRKNTVKSIKKTPLTIPRFTALDSFKYQDGKYQVYSPIEPLFYRAAFRNYKLAEKWHKEYLRTSGQTEMHKEIEYSLMTIISAVSCLEAYINMVIKRYPTKPQYKKLKDHKKQWLLVSKALNKTNPFKERRVPFSRFSKAVNLRNDALHYPVKYKTPIGQFSPIYNSYNHNSARMSVDMIDPMIERLSENSTIPLPGWLRSFRGGFGYWDEAFS